MQSLLNNISLYRLEIRVKVYCSFTASTHRTKTLRDNINTKPEGKNEIEQREIPLGCVYFQINIRMEI